MALYEAFHTLHDPGPTGEVTIALDSLIEIVAGTVSYEYRGTGFTYDAFGGLIGGTFTSFEIYDSANGGLQARVTGLSVPVSDYLAAIAAGDTDIMDVWFRGNDTVLGSAEDDFLAGYAGADSIVGGAGNDYLDGGDDAAVDTLIGGVGDDVYTVGSNSGVENDIVIEKPGEGHDTVGSYGNYGLPDNVEALVLLGHAEIAGSGNALDNFLQGNNSTNLLWGQDGNDTLDGLGGDDTLIGGNGDDTYVVGSGNWFAIRELPGGGNDTAMTSIGFVLPDEVENLVATGTDSVSLTGNGGANVITGNDAGDGLDGGAGDDTLNGGTGNDGYVVDSLADVINDRGGVDTVISRVEGYVLPDAIENLTLAEMPVTTGTGNAQDNEIYGNSQANVLYGLDGADLLYGDPGADTLIGGNGDDTYEVDDPGDTIIELASGGIDRVLSHISFTLPTQVEDLVLENPYTTGTGNSLNNHITGYYAADTLDGGAGADTLTGGDGDDTYYVDNPGDVVVESGNDRDTIFASVGFDLAAAPGVRVLTLIGASNIDATGSAGSDVLTGNDGNNVIRSIAAGQSSVYGDTLSGGAGNDSLVGNAGGDFLDGGTGADTMTGGTGRDVYVVDNAGDIVVEDKGAISGGEGDEVQAWVSYAAPANVEYLTLMGHDAINLTANASAVQTLTGNDAANVLDANGGVNDDLYGMDGNDTLSDGGGYARMYGGNGDDTYVVTGSIAPWIVEEANGGIDTVRYGTGSYGSFTLGDNLENLVMAGGQSGYGNAGDNVITGNAGSNFIDGKAGADTMIGGAGDDQYTIDNAGDVVVEADGQGYDTIVTYGISVSLAGMSVERVDAEMSGFVDLDITGNASDNFLRGSDGRNVIDGGAGADTMQGYSGDDVYVVDDAADVIWESSGGGKDSVRSSAASYTLADEVESLRLVGGGISGTGNALANSILGNDANNVLSGAGGNDMLWGGAGNDTLTGGAGDDSIDGDAGSDTVTYAGNRALYTVTRSAGLVLVSGAEGNDTLSGIDAIAFADQTLVLDPHSATGTASIAGTAKEDRVLTASASNVIDADGIGAFSYQWFREGNAIAGATSSTYTAVGADVGQTLSARITFVDGLGNTETLWSNATSAVVATDHVPPTVVSFTPADEATAVAPDANVVVTFSEAVARGAGTITLEKADGSVVETYAASSDRVTISGSTLTIDPTAALHWATGYKVEFTAGSVTDIEGNAYAGTSGYNFQTAPMPDVTPPVLLSVTPTHMVGTAVATDSSFVLRFSEPVHQPGGSILLLLPDGIPEESYWSGAPGVTYEGDTIVIHPFHLVDGGDFTFSIWAGTLQDDAGNMIEDTLSATFHTAIKPTTGTPGDDDIRGDDGRDQISAGVGNDTVHSSRGNDTIDGGSGTDTVVYDHWLQQTTITRTVNGVTVSYPSANIDTDTLVNVERLTFTDYSVALDIDGNAGQAYRLYQAAFDRKPDMPGLGYQMHDLDIGWSLWDIAGNFIASPEFQSTYGSVNNTQFITLLYRNVLHREPEQAGLDYHLNEFAQGQTRVDMLIHFSESPENQANVVGQIENGMVYTWPA